VSEPVVRFERVWKSFGRNVVLRDLELEIQPGETFTILGGSGTGKSVTLRLMIGLLRADRGRIWLRGREVTRLPEEEWRRLRADFGMVFQGSALFDSLSVLENVAYPLREHLALDEASVRARVAQKLALVGLEDVEALLPSALSGGMRKRVAVARAVVRDPSVILYDEPTTGLDPANGRRIAELIRSLQHGLGVTSVVVTHDLPLCFSVSDRVGLLSEGRLVQVAPPAELRARPAPELREFLAGASLERVP
jgi:phospholipid/cholesterol/gamma-HCH transport system ATP-binding protein